MNNKKKENIYDASGYSDNELYDLLDLNNPTDRELEAKIIFMIKKYNNMQNKSGYQLAKFFTDIYNHFFENEEEDREEETIETVEIEEINENIRIDISEGFDNMKPFDNTKAEIIDTTQLGNQAVTTTSLKIDPSLETTNTQEKQNIGFIKPLDYAPDKLNPLLNQTIKRIISIDSQYRDDKRSMPTNFSFNLSSPLKDVVSLKLYSVQIPYTWYTISKSFGSNFFYFKGNVPGLLNNENQYMIFDISSGNYNAQDLVTAINSSLLNKRSVYSDVSFGYTNISYNQNTSLANINIDITKQFSENSYYLEFDNLTSPNDYDTSRNQSIPSFLGFNNQTYQLNTINSSFTLPTDYNSNFYSQPGKNFILTETNNYFTIIKYISNYNSSNNTVDNFNSNSTVDVSFNIILSLTPDPNIYYSRNDILSDLSNQIHSCPYLSNESYIKLFKITDLSNTNYGNAYYQLKIKPNRYTTNNLSNSKIFVQFPNETNIWTTNTSCFRFTGISNEINTVVAETAAIPQTINYTIVGAPKILLTCSSDYFVSPLNNIQIPIQSSGNKPYTLEQYLTAINTSIVNITNTNYFLGGPPSTTYKYVYNLKYKPNYTYCYVDDNDIFNLFLKINKTFVETMYRLDLTNTFLYNYLYLGDDFGGTQLVTQNDTIPITGYINNNSFTVLTGTMPKVDLNQVDVKISFDVSGRTFGNQTYYDNINENFYLGNIYLKKSDNDYININNKWNLEGRTYVVTETTYIVTAKTFEVPLNRIGIPSNVIDVSSSGFSIPQTNLTLNNNYINVPNPLTSIYFNDNNFSVNRTNLIVNGNNWTVNGNSWTIDTYNNWTVTGDTFITNDTSWNITNMNFNITNNNSINANTLTLSGDFIELSGNYFNVYGSNSNKLNLYYNNNNIWSEASTTNENGSFVWKTVGTSYTVKNNIYTITTNNFAVNATQSSPLLFNNSNTLNFNNSKIILTGSNLNISGNTSFSGVSLNNNNFTAIGNNTVLSGNIYSITGTVINYYGTTITINPLNVLLPTEYGITINGIILAITSTYPPSNYSPLQITNSNYSIIGNILSLDSSHFTVEGSATINSKNFVLDYNQSLNLLKDDIIVYGDTMNVIGTGMDINGNNWDVSCNSLKTFNPNLYQNVDTSQLQTSTTTTLQSTNGFTTGSLTSSTDSTIQSTGYLNYNYSINSISSNDIKFKGNNITIPNNGSNLNTVSLNYRQNNVISLDVSGLIYSNAVQINSVTDGMQVDISNCIISSSDLIYIESNGKDYQGNRFTIDISSVIINNNTNNLIFNSNLLQYPYINSLINPTINNNSWELSGNEISFYANTNTINIDGNNYNGTNFFSAGTGVIKFSSPNTIQITDSSNNTTSHTINSGYIDAIKGTNMYLKAIGISNVFNINMNVFNISGNTILIDDYLNTQYGTIGQGYINFPTNYNYNLITLPGSIIRSPDNNNFIITCSNKNKNSNYYDLSATNITLISNNLSIKNNILAIYGNIFAEPTESININSSNLINVSNINYLIGNRPGYSFPVTTTGSSINVSQDIFSKLHYITGLSSTISISGNIKSLSSNSLSMVGNLSVSNNASFITTFSTNDYPNNSLKLSSELFNILNNDTLQFPLTVSGENLKVYGNAIIGNSWSAYANLLTVNSINSDWNINSNRLYVQSSNFNINTSTFTLPGADFYIPGNSVTIKGNNITIPGNTFSSGSNEINLVTPLNAPNTLLDISSIIFNIYDNEFVLPGNTISYDANKTDGSTTWTAINYVGFNLKPTSSITTNSIINNSSQIILTGDNINIFSDGYSSFLIDASSLNINTPSSSDSSYNIANNGNITFIGKTYTYKNIPVNLGTNLLPYDFSINVVYNDTYLPMTNLASNSSYLSSYSIPDGTPILKIYPRFSSPDSVFGNEFDISYTVFNNTGKDIISTSLSSLQSNIISLLESYTDRNGSYVLSGSKILLSLNQSDPNNITVDSTLNLVFNKSITNTDYSIEFQNYEDSTGFYESWKANFFIDPSFVDISYGLINNDNNSSIMLKPTINQAIVQGTTVVKTINILLKNNVNNILTFIAYEDGTISNNVTITIPVYSNGSEILYSRDGLIKTINSLLAETIAAGTFFSTTTTSDGITYVQMKSNINLIYKSKDYNLVFYDTISFVSCYVGATSVKNTTWDSTVGWILGFRTNSAYDLSQYTVQQNGISVLGDTGVCTNLFNYFLLCIDDFTQNHLNDGLITITSTDKSVPLPSYANKTKFICDPATNTLTYNNLGTTDYSKLTQNQIYSITQIANEQSSTTSNLTNGVSSKNFGTGPYVQDIFGLIPMKVSGQQPGSTYVEFGGTLQNQERLYFGPVNIHRMSVKLVTDRGDIVDLNDVNWSFSLLCEQLYKPRPSS